MTRAISDILQFVEENDIKFIRLAFCDMFGVQKNIAILSSLSARTCLCARRFLRRLCDPRVWQRNRVGSFPVSGSGYAGPVPVAPSLRVVSHAFTAPSDIRTAAPLRETAAGC